MLKMLLWVFNTLKNILSFQSGVISSSKFSSLFVKILIPNLRVSKFESVDATSAAVRVATVPFCQSSPHFFPLDTAPSITNEIVCLHIDRYIASSEYPLCKYPSHP